MFVVISPIHPCRIAVYRQLAIGVYCSSRDQAGPSMHCVMLSGESG